MIELPDSFRVLRPHPNVWAFYDGRATGRRLWSDEPNWLDDGAYELGVATFAIVVGHEALVYDTHISTAHAQAIRRMLEEDLGVTSIRVVLSHWHVDHVAGNAAFADCEILSNRLTAEALVAHRAELEGDAPPVSPLVMPNRIFEAAATTVTVGDVAVDLIQVDIHSHDGTLLLVKEWGLLFAGDALEDTVTYVAEPERLAVHLRDLARLHALPFTHILPNHGDPEIIAAGGYPASLIDATETYVRGLLALEPGDARSTLSLEAFVADDVAAGRIGYFAPYEAVHRRNVEQALAAKAALA
ncbi:MAG TPA: MBL fold metallo-hydrolase [Hansschlegelia sp.]